MRIEYGEWMGNILGGEVLVVVVVVVGYCRALGGITKTLVNSDHWRGKLLHHGSADFILHRHLPHSASHRGPATSCFYDDSIQIQSTSQTNLPTPSPLRFLAPPLNTLCSPLSFLLQLFLLISSRSIPYFLRLVKSIHPDYLHHVFLSRAAQGHRHHRRLRLW